MGLSIHRVVVLHSRVVIYRTYSCMHIMEIKCIIVYIRGHVVFSESL